MTIRGVILAGGKGTRLGELTKVTNKHLLPLGREPASPVISPGLSCDRGRLADVAGGLLRLSHAPSMRSAPLIDHGPAADLPFCAILRESCITGGASPQITRSTDGALSGTTL